MEGPCGSSDAEPAVAPVVEGETAVEPTAESSGESQLEAAASSKSRGGGAIGIMRSTTSDVAAPALAWFNMSIAGRSAGVEKGICRWVRPDLGVGAHNWPHLLVVHEASGAD
eukprot:scaffold258416_cov36-Tisochrysis_lutea.AAC.1